MQTPVALALLSVVLAAVPAVHAANEAPLRLAVAGLAHGHAEGFFRALKARPAGDVRLVGVWEPDASLRESYARRHALAPEILFASLDAMLDKVRPEAVAAFTATYDHPVVVEACAARRIAVMMEKPLAVRIDHARQIERVARSGGIPVIVNYETTWYRSHAAMGRLVRDGALGPIRKMVAMDGHQGPKEIGVGPEFLAWLTDPLKNGAGALYDFGCYGANLMTWLMNNQRPIEVTAVVQQLKPRIYPQVDDEATIVLEYAGAQGIVQASWNWPYSRKDFEVYGATGYANAYGSDTLKVRLNAAGKEEAHTLAPLAAAEHDSISYLKAVARGQMKPAGLSSIENNMIVTEILEAARESARSGRRVALK
jgi:predicted dehydrogenase